MAHVHGAAKAAAHATAQHVNHAAHAMHATHGHAAMTAVKHAGAAVGVAAATQTHTGKGLMSVLSKHPLLVFTLGVATGYLAHKYRKEIIASATQVTELGKDFVMHQKENLEDLVAECQECPEEDSKA
jgi:pyruvate-formate lyase